jgi:hypothetical protein
MRTKYTCALQEGGAADVACLPASTPLRFFLSMLFFPYCLITSLLVDSAAAFVVLFFFRYASAAKYLYGYILKLLKIFNYYSVPLPVSDTDRDDNFTENDRSWFWLVEIVI